MIEEEEEEATTASLAEVKELSGWAGWYFLINRGARNGSGSFSRWEKCFQCPPSRLRQDIS